MTSSFERLAKRMGFPGSQRLISIFEYLMSPEQAEIADALPGSSQEVAEKIGVDVETVKKELEDLFFKGAVIPRGDLVNREKYKLPLMILQLHDAALASKQLDFVKDKAFFQLWHEFSLQEMYPFMMQHADAERAHSRVVPAYNSIKDIPGVLPWENFREIIKAQELIAVVPCSCRWRTTAVGELCNFTSESHQWKCLQFGRSALYAIERGSGMQLTHEQALELADQAEEEGLVRNWSYYSSMQHNTSCQCCSDCCYLFISVKQNDGDMGKFLAKSRYEAQVEEADCSGCQNCLERCHFEAIDLYRSGKKYKAKVDPEKCWGCGVCVLKCETGALKMKAVRPPEYIPQSNR